MFQVTEEVLQDLVKKYLPKTYWPRKEGPVRSISRLSPNLLTKLANRLGLTKAADGTFCSGFTWNLSILKQEPGFRIYISSGFTTEEEAAFVLLHETGHVDWWVNPERQEDFPEDKKELYADFFAFEQLSSILGCEKALDILAHCASVDGFAKEMDKDG